MKVTGRVIDVKRNIDVLLYNHCCSGRSISITNCESVFVALVTQHAKRMRHIVIYRLPRSTVFFRISS